MQLLLHPLFLSALTLGAINQLLEWEGVYVPVVHAYLDDLCCMPIVLTLALVLQRLVRKDPAYRLRGAEVVYAVVLFGLLFEWWLPGAGNGFHGDVLDVVAYSVGAGLFWVFVNGGKGMYRFE